jgi:hypothetical protein
MKDYEMLFDPPPPRPLSSMNIRDQQTTLGGYFADIVLDWWKGDVCIFGRMRGDRDYPGAFSFNDFRQELGYVFHWRWLRMHTYYCSLRSSMC